MGLAGRGRHRVERADHGAERVQAWRSDVRDRLRQQLPLRRRGGGGVQQGGAPAHRSRTSTASTRRTRAAKLRSAASSRISRATATKSTRWFAASSTSSRCSSSRRPRSTWMATPGAPTISSAEPQVRDDRLGQPLFTRDFANSCQTQLPPDVGLDRLQASDRELRRRPSGPDVRVRSSAHEARRRREQRVRGGRLRRDAAAGRRRCGRSDRTSPASGSAPFSNAMTFHERAHPAVDAAVAGGPPSGTRLRRCRRSRSSTSAHSADGARRTSSSIRRPTAGIG